MNISPWCNFWTAIFSAVVLCLCVDGSSAPFYAWLNGSAAIINFVIFSARL